MKNSTRSGSSRRSKPSHPGEFIRIEGARQNNLKGIDLRLPLNKLIVVTGVSGSGKSSLAFDTVYSEGQRRYVTASRASPRPSPSTRPIRCAPPARPWER